VRRLDEVAGHRPWHAHAPPHGRPRLGAVGGAVILDFLAGRFFPFHSIISFPFHFLSFDYHSFG
jgi:hypothetical protein